MADFSQVLLQSNNNGQPQDSVTKLLVNQSPSFSDVQNAYLSTLGRPLNAPVSLGDVLNQMRAAKIKEAQAVQGMNVQQQQLANQKERLTLDKLKMVNDAFNSAMGMIPADKQEALFKHMENSPQSYDPNDPSPMNARMAVLGAAREMGIKPIMGKAGNTIYFGKKGNQTVALQPNSAGGLEDVTPPGINMMGPPPTVINLGNAVGLKERGGGLTELPVGLPPTRSVNPTTREVFTGAGVPGAQVGTGAEKNVQVSPLPVKTPVQQQGSERLSQNLKGVVQDYLTLDQMGGIVNPDKSSAHNIAAFGKASGAGQYLAGAVGAEEQQVRQRINNAQPMIINAIRQATNMSARAMDSNTELKFYMQTLGSPQADIWSSLAALDAIDRTYGDGHLLDGMDPKIVSRVRNASNSLIQSHPLPSPVQLEQRGSALDEARAAIAQGADRNAVIQRLKEAGISPDGL